MLVGSYRGPKWKSALGPKKAWIGPAGQPLNVFSVWSFLLLTVSLADGAQSAALTHGEVGVSRTEDRPGWPHRLPQPFLHSSRLTMADPSITSPSGTPLRSPNAPLTLSFPFPREGSRAWPEGREPPLPRDLPSPLPTKRNRTYSAYVREAEAFPPSCSLLTNPPTPQKRC